jgi:hypothetical protein
VPAKIHRIKLSEDERLNLEAIRDHKITKEPKDSAAKVDASMKDPAKDTTPRKTKPKKITPKRFKAMAALSLLLADEGPGGASMKDAQITAITGLSSSTLELLRKRCCEVGPLAALERKQRETPPRAIKITGDVQAHITQIACSQAPAGHARWTLQMIADRVVELNIIDSISHQSVSTILKKVNSSHGQRNAGASRPRKMPPS